MPVKRTLNEMQDTLRIALEAVKKDDAQEVECLICFSEACWIGWLEPVTAATNEN